jgi:hypothetical protein
MPSDLFVRMLGSRNSLSNEECVLRRHRATFDHQINMKHHIRFLYLTSTRQHVGVFLDMEKTRGPSCQCASQQELYRQEFRSSSFPVVSASLPPGPLLLCSFRQCSVWTLTTRKWSAARFGVRCILFETYLYVNIIVNVVETSLRLHCHVLLTRHGVWIVDCIYWTLITRNYNSFTDIQTYWITAARALSQFSLFLLSVAQ